MGSLTIYSLLQYLLRCCRYRCFKSTLHFHLSQKIAHLQTNVHISRILQDMIMKQSSKYSSYDAERNGINIFTFMLKDQSVTGVPKMSNASRCRNRSNNIRPTFINTLFPVPRRKFSKWGREVIININNFIILNKQCKSVEILSFWSLYRLLPFLNQAPQASARLVS